MKLEKLNPWNWFKHEDATANQNSQIPVTKNDIQPLSSNNQVDSIFQLHREMDRLFDNVFSAYGFPSLRGASPSSSLLAEGRGGLGANLFNQAQLDISGDQERYEILLNVPGLSTDDVAVDLDGDRLIIRGSKQENTETKDKHYYRVERQAGSFQRTLALPEDADADNISATLKEGVLTVSIPRREIASKNSKRITINS